MNAKELIEELKKYDGELLVRASNYCSQTHCIFEVEIGKERYDDDSPEMILLHLDESVSYEEELKEYKVK